MPPETFPCCEHCNYYWLQCSQVRHHHAIPCPDGCNNAYAEANDKT